MKFARALTVLALAMSASFLHAQGSNSTVGYVDVDKVTRRAVSVTSRMDNIETRIKNLQTQAEGKNKTIADLTRAIERGRDLESKEEQDKKKKELMRLKNEFEQLQRDAKRTAQELEATVFEPLMKEILLAIEEVAADRKLEVILRGEAVLYGTKSADITEDVIRKLDQKRGTTSSPARPSSTPAPARNSDTPANTPRPTPDAEPTSTPEPTPAATEAPTRNSPASTPTPAPTRRTGRPVDRQTD